MGSYSPLKQECHAGRRRHSRLRVALPARLVTLDGTFHGTLIDLSFKGGKIVIDRDLRVGGQAELSWGQFGVFCTIRWSGNGMCGLKFEEPLPPHILIETRDLTDASRNHDTRRETVRQFVAGAIRL
jgi:PilZ domain